MAFRFNVIFTSFTSSFNPADCPYTSKFCINLYSLLLYNTHHNQILYTRHCQPLFFHMERELEKSNSFEEEALRCDPKIILCPMLGIASTVDQGLFSTQHMQRLLQDSAYCSLLSVFCSPSPLLTPPNAQELLSRSSENFSSSTVQQK